MRKPELHVNPLDPFGEFEEFQWEWIKGRGHRHKKTGMIIYERQRDEITITDGDVYLSIGYELAVEPGYGLCTYINLCQGSKALADGEIDVHQPYRRDHHPELFDRIDNAVISLYRERGLSLIIFRGWGLAEEGYGLVQKGSPRNRQG